MDRESNWAVHHQAAAAPEQTADEWPTCAAVSIMADREHNGVGWRELIVTAQP